MEGGVERYENQKRQKYEHSESFVGFGMLPDDDAKTVRLNACVCVWEGGKG